MSDGDEERTSGGVIFPALNGPGLLDYEPALGGVQRAATPSLNPPRFSPLRLVRRLPTEAKRRTRLSLAGVRQLLTQGVISLDRA